MLRLLVPVTVLTLLASGCAAFSDDAAGGDGLTVAAAFYPLEYVAQRVAGDRADVEDLTQPGQEPHDLEIGIQQTATIAAADVVVLEKGLQPAVDDAVAQSAPGEVVDAAAVVGLESFADHGEDGEDRAHGHDTGTDPHFWQDPLKMAALGDAVADALSEADPDHADEYESNAGELRADLEALDGEYREGLADCERDTVVVSHDAFGYLHRYGLELAPIAGLSPDAEPTAADLAALQDLIRSDGITTVFGERLAPPRLAATLADDMGVATAVLDPVEGLTDETADEDYLSLMRANLAALREADGCR